ncbi:MAG: hypothetical protein AAGN66_14970 [Acidobacteriota bacterium]
MTLRPFPMTSRRSPSALTQLLAAAVALAAALAFPWGATAAEPSQGDPCLGSVADLPPTVPGWRYFGNLFNLDGDRPPERLELSFWTGPHLPQDGVDIDLRVVSARRTEPAAGGYRCLIPVLSQRITLLPEQVVGPDELWFGVPRMPSIWLSLPMPELPPEHVGQDLLFIGYGMDPADILGERLAPAADRVAPACDDDGEGRSQSTDLPCADYITRRTHELSSLYIDEADGVHRSGLHLRWLLDLESGEPGANGPEPEDGNLPGRLDADGEDLKDIHIRVHARPGMPPPG